MAQKVLVEFVTETIRDVPAPLVKAGWDLVPLLQNANLSITAAFWQFLGLGEGWRLVLSSPLVQTEGPRRIILTIQTILAENEEIGLRLSDILVQSPVSTLVQSAKYKYRAVPFDRRTARRTNLSEGEAYVYLLL